MNGELDPAGTDELLGPVEELTETLHRWVNRGIRPVVVLILLYYGGSQYGSHYISRPFWQNVILWPIFLFGFAIVLADNVGGKRAGKPKKVSRWLARKLVVRRELKGAPVACQVSISADQPEDGSGEPIEPLPGESVYQTAGQGPGPSSRRNVWILAWLGLVPVASAIVLAASISVDRSSSPANQVTEDQLRSGDCLTGSNLELDTNSPWPDSFTVVPCANQHIAEVFFSGTAWPQSQAYPGDNAVDNQADDRCNAAFTAYDGTFSDNSVFTYDTVDPVPADDWASGDRWLVCVAYDSTSQYPGGAPVDYSIKGSNR
jgi:hypothetical protein